MPNREDFNIDFKTKNYWNGLKNGKQYNCTRMDSDSMKWTPCSGRVEQKSLAVKGSTS